MLNEDTQALFGMAIAITILFILVYVIKKVWIIVTNPDVTHKLGSKTKSAIDGAARTAGEATSAVEDLAKSAKTSFMDGRRGDDNES